MSDPKDEGRLERIDRGISRVETVLVVLVMLVMIILATLQLFLDKLFDARLEWADIIIRQMVLWVAFLGGALATYEGRHIAIDAVGKFLKPKVVGSVRILTSLAALGLSVFLLVASIQFVKDEIESGSKVFGEFPAWVFELVMPIALIAIVFHFFVATYKWTFVARGLSEPPQPADAEKETEA